ncbi:MAG: twin-arginine translocase TatA/TatE family subunit [Chloroflexi bacterium]|nr:twin-arginine translocase TatA/TatE family subunit [Chloroflexota bacterium]
MGPLQVVIVLVIVLLLFGVGKLPQVGDLQRRGRRLACFPVGGTNPVDFDRLDGLVGQVPAA